MAYDIFISYRREGGADKARLLETELSHRGYKVFYDFNELTDGVFDKRIMDAIESAPIFIFLMTPHALDRCVGDEEDWVRKEIEYAFDLRKHIIPVNPDLSFTSFPENLPRKVREGLGQHQFSDVVFSSLYRESIGKLISERIRPLLAEIGRVAATNTCGALVRIESDLDCRVLRFGKEIAIAPSGEYTEIRLPKGKHKLEFIGFESDQDRMEIFLTINDLDFEEYIEVKLLDQYNARKEQEREEEAEREKEKIAKEAAYWNEQGDKAFDKKNYTEAVKWFRKAAEQGNAKAQHNLGYCYYDGQGVSQDYTEAVKWYRKAAEQGNAKAQNNLGLCYYDGQGVSQDYAEAVKWYRKAAEQGNAVAQNNLGYCYEQGQGVTQDYTEAVKWYRRAAEQGDAAAQHNLGYCYQYGQGVSQDYAEAVKWYRKAAEQGNADAQCNLGYCYQYGQGVSQDYAEAVKWYRKAAEQGHASAQNNLGVCYQYGQGVTKDIIKAIEWYKKAAAQGNKTAKDNLKDLGIKY